jgi:hypothetical protein
MRAEDDFFEMAMPEEAIENIIALNINPSQEKCSVQDIYTQLISTDTKKARERCRFLVKWTGRSAFVWEDEEVVKPYRQFIKNYFNSFLFQLTTVF